MPVHETLGEMNVKGLQVLREEAERIESGIVGMILKEHWMERVDGAVEEMCDAVQSGDMSAAQAAEVEKRIYEDLCRAGFGLVAIIDEEIKQRGSGD